MPTSDVERRVRVLAALADAHRLGIVDVLATSDLSPAEIGSRLRLPSNLLAHHLRTLESAGVLSRRRSSGDRRRTYLTLNATAMTDLVPTALGGPEDTSRTSTAGALGVSRLVFVCTANSARSQLAAALWNQTDSARDLPATSAGTRSADRIAPGALDVARRNHLRLEQIRPRSLSQLEHPLTDEDYLVTVCDSAHEELSPSRTRPTDAHWSVPDPVAVNTAHAFDTAYDDLATRVAQLASRLRPVG